MAIQDGFYTTYVFKNLSVEESSEIRYIAVVKCPNWQYTDIIKVGDIGFINYEFVNSGEEYIDRDTGEVKTYKYTGNYFMNFIKEQMKDNTKEFKF